MEKALKNITPYGFLPQRFPQISSTPGDFYGTFGGRIEAMSPKEREKAKQDFKVALLVKYGKKGGPGYIDITIGKYPENVSGKEKPIDRKEEVSLHSPFKSGWPGRVFDLYPYSLGEMPGTLTEKTYYTGKETLETKYGNFIPCGTGKKLGGMKAGGFSKFPDYTEDRYIDPWRIAKYGPTGKPKEQAIKSETPFYPPVRNKTFAISSTMQKNIDIHTNAKNWMTRKPLTYTREFVSVS